MNRDEFSTTFERANGSQIRQVSNEALNFQSEVGWTEISTEIVKDSSGWAGEQQPLAADFANSANASGAVTVAGDGHDVSFVLDGIGAGRGKLVASDEGEKSTHL